MQNTLKKIVIASMGVSGLVAVAALVDIFIAFPFAQSIVMDIMFILGAGLIIYMGYDAYQDMR